MGGRDEQDKLIVRSVEGKGENFEDVVEQHLSRRNFLKTAAVTSGVVVAATTMGGRCCGSADAPGADAAEVRQSFANRAGCGRDCRTGWVLCGNAYPLV